MSTDTPIPDFPEEPLSVSSRVFLAQQAGDWDAFYTALRELSEEEQAGIKRFFSYSPADGVSVVC